MYYLLVFLGLIGVGIVVAMSPLVIRPVSSDIALKLPTKSEHP
jgi:hypothetical protein